MLLNIPPLPHPPHECPGQQAGSLLPPPPLLSVSLFEPWPLLMRLSCLTGAWQWDSQHTRCSSRTLLCRLKPVIAVSAFLCPAAPHMLTWNAWAHTATAACSMCMGVLEVCLPPVLEACPPPVSEAYANLLCPCACLHVTSHIDACARMHTDKCARWHTAPAQHSGAQRLSSSELSQGSSSVSASAMAGATIAGAGVQLPCFPVLAFFCFCTDPR